MNKLFYNLTTFVIIAVMLGSHSYAQAAPAHIATSINNSYYGAAGGQDRVPGTQSGHYDIGPDRDPRATAAVTPPAFPGAEGFGANSLGGRGGRIIEVVNLNDSGTGSLRACVEASGARICVFRTGGLINLKSTLSITNPYITIAGQTARGGGITLKRFSEAMGGDTLAIGTHDVVIRYVTFRPGPGGSNHAAQIASDDEALFNIMIDHCTFSWGVDSNIETWYRVINSTIQWSIISEALNCSTHPKGCHSKGLMIGGYYGPDTKGSENISVLNNLMASNLDRNPLIQMCGIGQVINNVSYNAGTTFSHQQLGCPNYTSYVNWINNYHKMGPSGSQIDLKIVPSEDGVCTSGKVYMSGNIGNNGSWTYSFSDSCDADAIRSNILTEVPAPAPTVISTNANNAYNNVLAGAGNNAGLNCDGTWIARRDAIDTRIVNDVINGTGHIIDDPSQVSGWITPAPGTPCTDSDHDGMPDDWEANYGLNQNDYSDAVADADGDGYTNVEEYLNGTVPNSSNTITISGNAGVAGAGATITYTGGSTTADGTTGNYSFTVSYGWSGTVTPFKAGYLFLPTSRTFSNVVANQTGQDYTAIAITSIVFLPLIQR